jgi:hypothetical protein
MKLVLLSCLRGLLGGYTFFLVLYSGIADCINLFSLFSGHSVNEFFKVRSNSFKSKQELCYLSLILPALHRLDYLELLLLAAISGFCLSYAQLLMFKALDNCQSESIFA